MRGIVFNEFIEFVDQAAGPEMTEKMLEQCDLASGGIYTTVGNYDHQEIIKMVVFLNQATGKEVSELVEGFGVYLFGQLAQSYSSLLGDETCILNFLEGIEHHIHTEVRKLYPSAELPRFTTERLNKTHLIMHYESARPFADLAYGMILGAAKHFKNKLDVNRTDEQIDDRYYSSFDVKLI